MDKFDGVAEKLVEEIKRLVRNGIQMGAGEELGEDPSPDGARQRFGKAESRLTALLAAALRDAATK